MDIEKNFRGYRTDFLEYFKKETPEKISFRDIYNKIISQHCEFICITTDNDVVLNHISHFTGGDYAFIIEGINGVLPYAIRPDLYNEQSYYNGSNKFHFKDWDIKYIIILPEETHHGYTVKNKHYGVFELP